MICVEYTSLQDKQRAYIRRVIPAIFQTAVDAGRYLPFIASTPEQLHELVRNGRYLDEPGPRDCVRPIALTQAEGGDCEDWAAVQLWHAASNGYPVRLVTAGDGADNFRHVYVEMWSEGRWYASDPKGNQQGRDFGLHSLWPVKRRWVFENGTVKEVGNEPTDVEAVSGSGCACSLRGSGADWDRSTSTRLKSDPPRFVDSAWWYANVPGSVDLAWRQAHGQSPPRSLTDRVDLQQYPFPQSVYPAGEVNAHAYFKLADKLLPNNSLFLKGVKFAGPPENYDRTVINDWGDFYRLVTESQQAWFWKSLSQFGPLQNYGGYSDKVIEALQDRLDAGTFNMTRGELMHWMRYAGGFVTNDVVMRNRLRYILGSNKRVDFFEESTDPSEVAEEANDLESVNLSFASRWADSMLEPGANETERRNALRSYAIEAGGNPSASDRDLAPVAAAAAAMQLTAQGIWWDDALEAIAAQGIENAQAVLKSLRPATLTAVAGSGSVLSKFIKRAGKVLYRVFVREPGRAIRNVAKAILSVDESAPWASTFLLRPLGFMAQAEVLKQLGNMMVEGTTAAFDTNAVVLETGATLQSAGQVLVMASPLLPPPYNVAAALVGTASIIAGGFITNLANTGTVHGVVGEDTQACVDEYNREVDCATGELLNPQDIALEQQRQANEQAAVSQQPLQPDPNTQVAGEWRQGSDGLFYGWHDFGPSMGAGQPAWFWLALQTDSNGQIVAAWAYQGGDSPGWVKL